MGVMSTQRLDRSQGQGSNDFEPVAQAAVNQLGQAFQGAFRTGDNLQRGVVNMIFGMVDPGMWNPARWVPGTDSSSCGQSSQGQAGQPCGGWGPMPSPPNAG